MLPSHPLCCHAVHFPWHIVSHSDRSYATMMACPHLQDAHGQSIVSAKTLSNAIVCHYCALHVYPHLVHVVHQKTITSCVPEICHVSQIRTLYHERHLVMEGRRKVMFSHYNVSEVARNSSLYNCSLTSSLTCTLRCVVLQAALWSPVGLPILPMSNRVPNLIVSWCQPAHQDWRKSQDCIPILQCKLPAMHSRIPTSIATTVCQNMHGAAACQHNIPHQCTPTAPAAKYHCV